MAIGDILSQGGGLAPLQNPGLAGPPMPQPSIAPPGQAGFAPQRDPTERRSMWADFGKRLREDPSMGRMLLAFGAQMLQPGDVATNFGKAALAMSQIQEEDRQRRFQEEQVALQNKQAERKIGQTDRSLDQAQARLEQNQVQFDAAQENERVRLEQAAERLDIAKEQLVFQRNADGRAELSTQTEQLIKEKTIEKLTMELEAMDAAGMTGFGHSNILVKIAQEQQAANPAMTFAEAAAKAVDILTPKSSAKGSSGQITPKMLLEMAADIQIGREENQALNPNAPVPPTSPVEETMDMAKELQKLLDQSNLR